MADLDFATITDLIKKNHPDIFPLLNKPGLWDVAAQIIQAEVDGKPWTDAQITAALQATPYYQTTNATQRSWDILQATDPATAKQKGDEATRQVLAAASQLGETLNPTQQWELVSAALQNGWDTNAIRYNLLAAINGYNAGGIPQEQGIYAGGGSLGESAAAIKGMANDYGIPMSDKATLDYAIQQQQGILDANAIKGNLIEQAKSLYGGNEGMDSALDRGLTVRQITDPYWQIASQELGVNPNTLDLTDPKWMRAIHQVDPKTGVATPMDLSNWTATVRSDAAYGFDQTDKAKTQGATLQAQLAQMMGAVG